MPKKKIFEYGMGIHQHVSLGMDGKEPPLNRILEAASRIVRRCKETAGDVEPAEGYKRKQIRALREFSSANDLYLNFHNFNTIFLDKGGENEVFYE